jgi:hypothetical protein
MITRSSKSITMRKLLIKNTRTNSSSTYSQKTQLTTCCSSTSSPAEKTHLQATT